jgi:FMN-dependent NADH-azoreductase
MPSLLYIEASPRGDHSASTRVARAFLEAYQQYNPQDSVDHLALFEETLPPFAGQGADQKMAQIGSLATGGDGIAAEGEWGGVLRVIERFKAADKVLISAPMWNFSIPFPLKHYIDLLCQPGLTFYVNRQGDYVGMVTGKPMQLILSSGSEYAMRFPSENDGTKTDFQRAYLEHIARFIGFEDIRCLKLQPAAASPRVVEPMLAEKLEQARQAAVNF